MRRAGVLFLSPLNNSIMAFFNRPNSEDNGCTDGAGQILRFLQEMAIAQDRRFDNICARLATLEKAIHELRELYKAPVATPPVTPVAPPAAEPAPRVEVPPVASPVTPVSDTVVPQSEPEQTATVAQPQPQPKSYPVIFFGPPAGAGFEASFNLPSGTDPRALYAVERTSDTEAEFYPLSDRVHRLRSNASSFLLPLCEVKGDLDTATAFAVDPAHFGKLKLADGYWEMVSKCVVECE